MNNFSEKVNFIWSIADLIRDAFKRSKYQDVILNLIFPLPNVTEQQAVAIYLDYETAKIDALISRIREGIEKLKEYSTALISAAVTGKIDVRGEITSSDDTDP